MTKALWAMFLTLAAIVAVALAIALGIGVPHPALVERAAACAFGLLGLGAGSIALSGAVGSGPTRRRAAQQELEAEAGLADLFALERALRFGTSSAGDFHAHVRPRLVSVARVRLARLGIALSDRDRASAVLGPDSWELVDPEAAPPTDRFQPGVPLARVQVLLTRLEALGEQG